MSSQDPCRSRFAPCTRYHISVMYNSRRNKTKEMEQELTGLRPRLLMRSTTGCGAGSPSVFLVMAPCCTLKHYLFFQCAFIRWLENLNRRTRTRYVTTSRNLSRHASVTASRPFWKVLYARLKSYGKWSVSSKIGQHRSPNKAVINQ